MNAFPGRFELGVCLHLSLLLSCCGTSSYSCSLSVVQSHGEPLLWRSLFFPRWDAMRPGLCTLHLGHSFCFVCSVHQLDPLRPVTSPHPSSLRVFVDKTVEGRPDLFPVSQAPSFAVLLAELLENDAAQYALELRDLGVRTPTDLWELCAKNHIWAARMRVRSRSPRKALGNTRRVLLPT